MRFFRAVAPVLLLLLGVGGAVAFFKTRPAPAKKAIENPGELVEVLRVKSETRKLNVVAHGTLTAARSVVVQPEVTGRVTWQHDALVPGGRVKKGEPLLRIDARDYKLAAEQLEANVEQAELQLRLERIQREVAKDEWQIIGDEGNFTEEGRALTFREPQLQAAQANLSAAKSARAKAQLSVGKTAISAPFNAWVQNEQVEVGQLVAPQTPVATLIGTDSYWVQVSVPADKLSALSLPGINDDEGSKAMVRQQVGGQTVEREGRLLRLLGDLDPVGRLVRLLVEVEDPLELEKPEKKQGAPPTPGELSNTEDLRLPLLLGAYVEVTFTGGELAEVVEVPRSALREGDKVFLYGKDDQLEVRPVNVVWRTPDSVLVRGGLSSGEQLITSAIATPLEGMKLRRANSPGAAVQGAAKAQATTTTEPAGTTDTPAATTAGAN